MLIYLLINALIGALTGGAMTVFEPATPARPRAQSPRRAPR